MSFRRWSKARRIWTDHLDLESVSALKDAIEKYQGTVIFVARRRYARARDQQARRRRLPWPYEEFLRKLGDR